MIDLSNFDISIKKMIKLNEVLNKSIVMTEYIERLVILDIIFGEPIHRDFISVKKFPFELPKEIEGGSLGKYYFYNMWNHFRGLYDEVLMNPTKQNEYEKANDKKFKRHIDLIE